MYLGFTQEIIFKFIVKETKVLKVSKLCHAVVYVESKWKSRDIPQRTRRQCYNHMKHFWNIINLLDQGHRAIVLSLMKRFFVVIANLWYAT